MIHRSRFLLAVTLATGLGLSACSSSPAPAPATPTEPATAEAAAPVATPTADEVIEAYIQATGGREVREAKQNYRARGTVTIKEMGIGGTVELVTAAPRKMLMEMTLQGLGTETTGTDGEIVWSKSAMTGNRILEGPERARALRSATFNAELQWRELFDKVELVGDGEFAGRPAWIVAFTTPEGTVDRSYYDKETHLLLGQEATVQSQMGEIKVRSTHSDYREVEGIKLAHTLEEHMVNATIVMQLEEVDFDVELPEQAFQVPADIAKLQKKPE